MSLFFKPTSDEAFAIAQEEAVAKPAYGLMILLDEQSDVDPATHLITTLDTTPFIAGKQFKAVSGRIIMFADNYLNDFLDNDGELKIGDRLLVDANSIVPLNIVGKSQTTYKFAVINEENILAVISNNQTINL